jgi:hypothetical protein
VLVNVNHYMFGGGSLIERAVDDSVSATDSLSEELRIDLYRVSISDTIAATDAILRAVDWKRTVNDTITEGTQPWLQEAYVKASNTDAGDEFGSENWGAYGSTLLNPGRGVAVSGNTVVIGANQEDGSGTGIDPSDNDSASNAGAVYVFVRDGGTWSQQAYIKASNAEAGDQFGYSVDIDGDTLVVGAIGEASNATGVGGNQAANVSTGAGAAYVFVRSGSTWTQQEYIKATNTGSDDKFGSNIAISGDTLAVSAIAEDGSGTGIDPANNNSASNSGAVYIYVRSGSTWTVQATIKAHNTGSSDSFGAALDLDSDTLVVGAPLESGSGTGIDPSDNNSATNAGAAYVFTRSGSTWSQQAYVKAHNTGASDGFGGCVAISGDTLLVGAPFEDGSGNGIDPSDNNSSSARGAAYVFTRSGSTWSQQAYVKSPAPSLYFGGAGENFGCSCALDGDTAAIGSMYFADSSSTQGVVYVLTRSGGTWTHEAQNKAYRTGFGYGDEYARSCAIDSDIIVIGAPTEDSNATGINGDPSDNSAANSGAAYIFRRNPLVEIL